MVLLKNFTKPVIRLYMKNVDRQEFRICLKNLSTKNSLVEVMVNSSDKVKKYID
jgi:hypothetical protein